MEKLIYVLTIPRGNQRLVVFSLVEIYDIMMEEINQLHGIEKGRYIRDVYSQEECLKRFHDIYCKMCKNNWNEKNFYITNEVVRSNGTCHRMQILEGEW